MDAPLPTLGVAAEPPPQARPEAVPLTVGTTASALASSFPPWPRSAQGAAAGLLAIALALLGWHVVAAQRWTTRPTALEPDAASAGRVELNRADHAALLQLPGVGETTARRIEDYRATHGGFRSVDELRRVPGVGPALLERLRPLVEVEPFESDEPDESPPPDRPPPTAKEKAAGAPRPAAGKKEEPAQPVDLNRATSEELQRLPGVGPTLAARILQVRERRPFQSVDDLRRVPGIGAKTLERLRPFVTVGE
jgi:competence protein ComEA